MNDSSLFDFINNSTELPVYSPAPVLGAALYPSHFSYQQEEEIPPELWQNKKNKSHHQHEEKVDVRRKSILKKTTNNTTIQKQPEPPKTTPPSVTVIDVDKDHDTSSATVTTNADDISLTSSCRQISKNSNVIDLKKDTYSRDNSHNSDSDDDSTSRFDLSQEKNTIQYDLKVATMGNAFVRTLSQRRRVGIIRESQNQLDEIRFNGVDNKTLKCTKSMPLPYDQNRSYSNHKSIDVTVDVVEKKVLNTESLEISTVVYMMLLGGAANNFVDGMSTGAAFSDSIKKGFSIGLAVFSQQLPQELGTLAIMINSGLGLKKTLVFNLIPISMGYFGFITGVILDNINDTFDDEVFAISAGMYCYIFLGTLLPELRDSFNEILQKDLIEASLVNVLQYIGICSGIALMYFISIYGDR
uniref:MgtE domain-containing protein n=1 Tax=Rhabditophanes sp. KR3021 TaxID=114890 RepID=A0AC35UDT9_9BILA